MTSEVVLMNRQAVAMAADSAVTISGDRYLKTYQSVDKLFPLVDGQPIAVMIYNNAEIMEEVMNDPLVKKALEVFPGAKVTSVKEPPAPLAPAPDELEEEPPIDPDDEDPDIGEFDDDDIVLSVLRESADNQKG